eukprot:5778887-Amphidinium_carterae.2
MSARTKGFQARHCCDQVVLWPVLFAVSGSYAARCGNVTWLLLASDNIVLGGMVDNWHLSYVSDCLWRLVPECRDPAHALRESLPSCQAVLRR